MHELREPRPIDRARSGDGRSCTYCQGPLDNRYYFCLGCATPYKDPDSVLPRMRAVRPSTNELVSIHAPNVATLFWTYAIVIVVGSVVLGAFSGGSLGAHVVIMNALLIVTTTFFAVFYWDSLKQQLGRVGFDHWAAWVGLLLLVPLLGLNYAYHQWIAGVLGMPEAPSLAAELRGDGLSEAALIFFIAIYPAIGEEIAFRGLVQHWLQVALRPPVAIAITAGLFAAIHLAPLSMPILFLAGLLLGWVKWKTGSLYPAMLLHFLHNFAVLRLFDA